jgi:hypothetical protein
VLSTSSLTSSFNVVRHFMQTSCRPLPSFPKLSGPPAAAAAVPNARNVLGVQAREAHHETRYRCKSASCSPLPTGSFL